MDSPVVQREKSLHLILDELYEHKCLLPYLVEIHGEKVGKRVYETQGLCSAICQKDWKLVKLLVNHYKIDVNLTTERGASPLLYASFSGHLESTQLLCEAKANIDQKSVNGETALMCATQQGHLEVVRCLLSRGKSSLNFVDNHGFTALMYAIANKRTQIIEMLVEDFGALLEQTNAQSILMLAITVGHLPHIRYLQLKSKEVLSALHLIIAAAHGRLDFITFSVENTDYKQISIFLKSLPVGIQVRNLYNAVQQGLFLFESPKVQNLLKIELKKIPLELITIISDYCTTHVHELRDMDTKVKSILKKIIRHCSRAGRKIRYFAKRVGRKVCLV